MAYSDSTPLAGRVALITGANTGIGRVTARELARQGATVFIAGLSLKRTQPALDEIHNLTGGARAEWLALDLGDFESVRQCAAAFLARGLPLHILINNAGFAGTRGLTKSGFELAFGVNHLGHFLLTQLLAERIRGSAPARIVTVASRAHRMAPGIDWDAVRKPTRSFTGVAEYAISKLANILFSAELGRRLAGSGVTTYALHPGVVTSDIWRSVPWPLRPLIKLRGISTEKGAQTTLYCATSAAAEGETGLYYSKSRVTQPTMIAQDRVLAAELWKRSEDWVR
jgi:NAD(P)-dependent dehydrogenase (short-subunit alcohol dehydrogenase family)